MKMIGTSAYDENGNPEVVFIWKAARSFFIEAPTNGAVMTRDNVEQLIAELESLLRED